MEEELNKFYEFFLKNNLNQRKYTGEDCDVYKLYCKVINAYDLSKNEQLKIDIEEFFDFFENREKPTDYFCKYDSNHLLSKDMFESYGKASFNWFEATKNMTVCDDFLRSKSHFNGKYCKAYLSIKAEKYVETLIKLQKFIGEQYDNHEDEKVGQCKFRNVPANDAIVMRFYEKEHYDEFIKYLDENKDIQAAYDNPNMFLPLNDHGLSLIPDDGGSYNYFVTIILFDYMTQCRDKNIPISLVNLENFITLYDCSNDYIMNSCGDDIIQNYKLILISKLNNVPDNEILSSIIKKPYEKVYKKIN